MSFFGLGSKKKSSQKTYNRPPRRGSEIGEALKSDVAIKIYILFVAFGILYFFYHIGTPLDHFYDFSGIFDR